MVGKLKPEPLGEDIGAVEGPVDSESLRQPRRAPRKVSVSARISAPAPGRVQSTDHLSGAQQQTGCLAGYPAHHVGAIVHAVGEVHVQVTGLTEHRGIAGGLSAESVGAWVISTHVRLDLGDTHGNRLRAVVVRQLGTKQEGRHLDGRMRQPGAL